MIIFILQKRSIFHSILARIQHKKQANWNFFRPFTSLVLSVFRNRTCILHHFAFLVWLPAHNFRSPITCFLPLKPHLLMVILPLFGMCFMAWRGFVYAIAVDVYAFCLAFSSKSHRIQHHFTLHLAPKRTAFCTKLHCVQHQNALRLAAYCTTFSSKQPKSWCKWRLFKINIHFACVYN